MSQRPGLALHSHCSALLPRYGLALVSGCGSSCPASYLEPEGRVLSVQTPPTSMLVLCVKMPGHALLEIMDDLRQNVSCTSLSKQVT